MVGYNHEGPMLLPSTKAELERLRALCATGLLDTPPEERFDRITRLAAGFFGVPICLVSLVDEDRQWFKSRFGLAALQTPKSDAFCAHAVAKRELMVVEDARLDPRFADNPLVTGAPGIRFYAGQPIFTPGGHALGTLCIIDTKARRLDAAHSAALRDFALLVEEEVSKVTVAETALSGTRALIASEARFEATFEQAAVGIAHVGLDGALLQVNRKFFDIVGYDKESLEKITFQEITHPDDLALDLQMLNETMAGLRASYSIEKRYQHRLGHLVWVNLTVSLLRDEHGTPDYFISVIEDIEAKKDSEFALHRLNSELEQRVAARTADLEATVALLGAEVAQRIQVEASLRLSEEHNRTILQASHDAFIGVDAAGVVRHWNRAAESMFGWTSQEAIGANLTALIIPAQHHAAHRAGLERFLHTGHGDKIHQRLEMPALTRHGTVIPVEMTIAPYHVGEQVFFGAFLHDITERREAAAALEQKQALLDAVLDSVDVGVVACDAQGEITLFNRAAARFHGLALTKTGYAGRAHACELYCADGITPLTTAEHPLERALSGAEVANAEMTFVSPGQATRFVFASGQRLRSSAGENVGAVVAMKDVTALKNSELQQAANEQRLRTITDNLPVLIAYIDQDQIVRFANATHEQWFGLPSASIIGKTFQAVVGDAIYATARPCLERLLGGVATRYEAVELVAGVVRTSETSGIAHKKDGLVVGAYLMTTDISAARRHESQLQVLARTDSLTGLPNRRSYEERLRDAVLRSVRSGQAIGLMILDVDFFKSINDSLGHASGDEVLKEFGQRLRSAVRATDTVCRLAGDEFTIILEGVTSLVDAIGVADKVLALVRAPFLLDGVERTVTTSIGIACQASAQPVTSGLTRNADAALYLAKAAGRNRYAVDAMAPLPAA